MPNQPFAYEFLSESYQRLYDSERSQNELFIIFATLAIFIAAMGLFGLATFSTQQRTKEVSIRKVLGAPVSSILRLLRSGDYHPDSDRQPDCLAHRLVRHAGVAQRLRLPRRDEPLHLPAGGGAGPGDHAGYHQQPDGEDGPDQPSYYSAQRLIRMGGIRKMSRMNAPVERN